MPRKPAPPRRGRPPGHSASRLMKRIVIAGAVYHKIKIAQVARDLGMSRSWASREAHHPETQRFIRRLKKQDAQTAVGSLRRALKAIADEMIPTENIYLRGGKIVIGHSDAAWTEFTRLRLILKTYLLRLKSQLFRKLVLAEPQVRSAPRLLYRK